MSLQAGTVTAEQLRDSLRFPARFRVYFKYILPFVVLIILFMGYLDKFSG